VLITRYHHCHHHYHCHYYDCSQWDIPLSESLVMEGTEGSNDAIISAAIEGASLFSSGKGRKGDSLH
jgi:hypothetical protein